MFDAIGEPLDQVACTVQHTVVGALCLAIRTRGGTRRLRGGSPNPLHEMVSIVALVCDNRSGARCTPKRSVTTYARGERLCTHLLAYELISDRGILSCATRWVYGGDVLSTVYHCICHGSGFLMTCLNVFNEQRESATFASRLCQQISVMRWS
jgi:hypothetical protein